MMQQLISPLATSVSTDMTKINTLNIGLLLGNNFLHAIPETPVTFLFRILNIIFFAEIRQPFQTFLSWDDRGKYPSALKSVRAPFENSRTLSNRQMPADLPR